MTAALQYLAGIFHGPLAVAVITIGFFGAGLVWKFGGDHESRIFRTMVNVLAAAGVIAGSAAAAGAVYALAQGGF